jgi:membrane protease subunit (stomatin/prohibitin family)
LGEIQFSDNHTDRSVSSGVNAGFQFDFHCERCNDTWRSPWVAYTRGQASGWLSRASGLLGGMLGNVGLAVDGLAESGFGEARDAALRDAIAQAKKHFHRCARCVQYVCARCWNADKGLCFNCAPSAEVEAEAAGAAGEAEGAREVAHEAGRARGAKVDTKRKRQLVCPDCSAETHGAKFCPECGKKLAQADACPACNAKVAPKAKFCPECGEKLAV